MTQVAGSAHGSLLWSTSSLSCVVADWYIVEQVTTVGLSSTVGHVKNTQFRHSTLVSHAISFHNRMKKKRIIKKKQLLSNATQQVSPSNIQRRCLRFEYFKTSRANVVRIFHHFLRELAKNPPVITGNKHRCAV